MKKYLDDKKKRILKIIPPGPRNIFLSTEHLKWSLVSKVFGCEKKNVGTLRQNK